MRATWTKQQSTAAKRTASRWPLIVALSCLAPLPAFSDDADTPVAWTRIEQITPAEQAVTPAPEPEVKPEPVAVAETKPEAKPEEEPAVKAEAEKAPSPYYGATTTNYIQPRYTGRLRVEYEYKKQGGDTDADLYGYWNAGAYNLGNGHLDVYSSGRLHEDVGGSSASTSTDTNDAYASPYTTLDDLNGVMEERILQLYGDWHDRAKRYSLRAGRQYVDIADYIHLDGAQVLLFENEKIGGRVYAGQPVSYYNSSISDDFASGVSLVGRPWTGNRSRLTFQQYHSDATNATDQNIFADVQQEISDALRARGQLSLLNGEFRVARLDLSYFSPDGMDDILVGASRWGTFDAKTRAYSPLYNVLGEQQPYTYAYAKLMYGITKSFLIAPAIDYRLVDSGASDSNNSNYRNVELSLIYEPSRAFSSSVGLQYWDVEGDDSFAGVTWDVRYRYRKIWEISGGAAYSAYSYNQQSDISYTANNGQTVITEDGSVTEDNPYVYTYFLQGKWKVTKKLILKLQGDIEDDKEASDLSYRGRSSVEVKF